MKKLGFAGKLAQAFILSKLTPLLVLASLLLGGFATLSLLFLLTLRLSGVLPALTVPRRLQHWATAGLLLVMSGIAVLVVRSISQPLEASVRLFNQLAASKQIAHRNQRNARGRVCESWRHVRQVSMLASNNIMGAR